MKKEVYEKLKELSLAFKFSWQGLQIAWKKQRAFRQEVGMFLVLLPVIYYLRLEVEVKLCLIILLLLLLGMELINSAIEAVIDRISTDVHPLSKEAKDLGSAAVFMVILINIVAWFYVIYRVNFN
jgi:diacylglycerol kinase (ATP)